MTTWTNYSRYGALRSYVLSENKEELVITCDDVIYYSISPGLSIDPDGGPYLEVNQPIMYDNVTLMIKEILSYKRITKTRLVITLKVS